MISPLLTTMALDNNYDSNETEAEEDDRYCCVCRCTDANVTIIPCIHTVCSTCIQRLQTCPLCRVKISRHVPYVLPKRVITQLMAGEPTTLSQFNALFAAPKHLYELTRMRLNDTWTKLKDGPTYEAVCAVCVMNIDLTLFDLFYACAPLTKAVLLDCFTCLHLAFGSKQCKYVTPKDVYFHFFLNHCNVGGRRVARDNVADMTCFSLHSMQYDIMDLAKLNADIKLMDVEFTGGGMCDCARAKNLITEAAVTEKECGTGTTALDVDRHDGEPSFFIPGISSGGSNQSATDVLHTNNYRWILQEEESRNIEDHENKDSKEDENTAVDCLILYSQCQLCSEMLDTSKFERNDRIDDLLVRRRGRKNLATTIRLMLMKDRSIIDDNDSNTKDSMEARLNHHYTDPNCALNRYKYVRFHRIVKHMSTLANKTFVSHLMGEMFPDGSHVVCPVYHLAVLCLRVIEMDDSPHKKTKRGDLDKWAHRVLKRHLHNVI